MWCKMHSMRVPTHKMHLIFQQHVQKQNKTVDK